MKKKMKRMRGGAGEKLESIKSIITSKQSLTTVSRQTRKDIIGDSFFSGSKFKKKKQRIKQQQKNENDDKSTASKRSRSFNL